jgi:hypothetical protein
MKRIGKVDIPQEAFLAVLNAGRIKLCIDRWATFPPLAARF